MKRSEKKQLRQLQSTRQLMDIHEIMESSVRTGHGELAFFFISPLNLSLLPQEAIQSRIHDLALLLQEKGALELMALDARESLQRTRDWYQERIAVESEPKLRELLMDDCRHMESISLLSTGKREFAIVLRVKDLTECGGELFLSSMEESIRKQGFRVRRARKQDLMRLLAIYYEQNISVERYDDLDGERWGAQ